MHEQLAAGVVRVPVLFVNAYLVDINPGIPEDGWVLVDSGLRGIGGAEIRHHAARRYGAGSPPRAIVLTHGHFDHAGSARALARQWNAGVFAHRLESPYLSGRSDYPPQDPTVGGALAMMSRVFPRGSLDLFAIYASDALLDWARAVTGVAMLQRSSHLRSAINIDCLPRAALRPRQAKRM